MQESKLGGKPPLKLGVLVLLSSALLLSVVLWSLLSNWRSPSALAGTQVVVTDVPPPPTCGYCDHNLVGKTVSEIGSFALQYVEDSHLVLSGTPEILLSRPLNPADFTALGLGCLPSYSTIEVPPLAMVILKGHFRSNQLGTSLAEPSAADDPPGYLGFVFDLWAGTPAATINSPYGAMLGAALNDPSLPSIEAPSTCPPPVPAAERRLHYGQSLDETTNSK